MTDLPFEPVPFLTRKMLAFEHAVKVEIRLTIFAFLQTTLKIKGITREGVFSFTYETLVDGQTHFAKFQIPDIPIFISVTDEGPGSAQGQLNAQLDLLMNGDKILRFGTGYIYTDNDISWPTQNVAEVRGGGGVLVTRGIANPAAGAEISVVTSTYKVTRLRSLRVSLALTAGMSARRAHFRIKDADGILLYEFFGAQDYINGATATYQLQPMGSLNDDYDNAVEIINIPSDLLLPPLSTIYTVTTNLDVADDWGAGVYACEEM